MAAFKERKERWIQYRMRCEKEKGHPKRDVPYTVGRLITTEEQGHKQQDALPGYRILQCKITHL